MLGCCSFSKHFLSDCWLH